MNRLAIRILCLVSVLLALPACDSSDSERNPDNNSIDCNASGTGIVAARIGGEDFCAFTSAASVENDLFILFAIGSFPDSPGATLGITAPAAEGTYTLGTGPTDDFVTAGFASRTDGIGYEAGFERGSGSIVVSNITEERVEGTFSFVLEEFDENTGTYTGETLTVTGGEFDVALTEL